MGGARGVRGGVKFWSSTADPAAVAGYGPFETADGRLVEIDTLRPAKEFFVARLKGIADREAAERLRNVELFLPRDRLPDTAGTAEFYHADLLGLAVVDAARAGGGPGMVMKPAVTARAIDAVAADARPRLLMSPRGTPLTQARVAALAQGPGVVLLCGRFEGVDERVIAGRGLEEVSIGDYVLAGGELAAMVLVDACVRLLPGVMGREGSLAEESFADGLLEYPQYTRPQVWEDRPIPDVLVGGDNGKVAAWRREAAARLTQALRAQPWT